MFLLRLIAHLQLQFQLQLQLQLVLRLPGHSRVLVWALFTFRVSAASNQSGLKPQLPARALIIGSRNCKFMLLLGRYQMATRERLFE